MVAPFFPQQAGRQIADHGRARGRNRGGDQKAARRESQRAGSASYQGRADAGGKRHDAGQRRRQGLQDKQGVDPQIPRLHFGA